MQRDEARWSHLSISVGTAEAVAVGVLVDSGARSIQAKNAQRQTEAGNANVEDAEEDLAGRGEPLAAVEVEPVDTGETVAEPGSEKSTDQTVQVTEDRNSLGDDPRNDPASHTKTNPETDGTLVALVHQIRLGAEAEVDVLQADMAVDDTGTDNSGDSNAVGNLAHQGASGREGRGVDI